MYLAHFGLAEPPFRITPHTEFFFEGANRGATLEALIYAVTHDEGIVKVSGEVGSGKTMLCRVLLERLPPPVVTIYLANPSLGRDEILLTIAEELKVDTSGKRTTVLLRALQDALIHLYAQGKRVIALIDEAHAMPSETLEEIRLLSNLESNRHKLLQIILFGQPELDEHLNLPNMRQLRERITHSFRLEPLVRSDIDNYIDFRMRAAGYKGPSVFGKSALRLIAHASEGLTRRINILADKSLLAAFADNSHEVLPKHAKAAIVDSGYRKMRPFRPSWWVAAGTLAAGLLIGFAAQHFLSPATKTGVGSGSGAQTPSLESPSNGAAPGTPSSGLPGAGSGTTASAASAASVAPTSPPAGAAGGMAPAAGAPSAAAGFAAGTTAVTDRSAPRMPPPTGLALATTTGNPQAIPIGVPTVSAATLRGSEPAPMGGPFKSRYAQERFAAARSWMTAAPEEACTIQLMTARNSDIDWIENFLARAQQLANSDQIYVYSWPFDGQTGYRVAYGLFDTLWACRDAIGELPESLRRYQPYPERIAVVRKLSGWQTPGMAQK
jgi:MSHA biogenesis protein MshM